VKIVEFPSSRKRGRTPRLVSSQQNRDLNAWWNAPVTPPESELEKFARLFFACVTGKKIPNPGIIEVRLAALEAEIERIAVRLNEFEHEPRP
jgi:hypothetical protein